MNRLKIIDDRKLDSWEIEYQTNSFLLSKNNVDNKDLNVIYFQGLDKNNCKIMKKFEITAFGIWFFQNISR